MQYLVIFTPKQKFGTSEMPSDFPQLLLEEEARAKDLYMEGLLRQSWVLGKRDRGAAVLFEAESPKHIQEIIDSFPLIEADYSNTQIFPLAPDPAFAQKS
ncbi:muconolactone Delta-isomerase family protein [Scytonema sp. NUACC26]|uniref:muconolactone Delta-isomerase family protein n=1 Tax=Scytonema sp. NUACC26 TaxID=3140176 RepID=UPI0034DCA173